MAELSGALLGPISDSKAVTPKDCKRLAGMDFPTAEMSQHAVREKSIWHGHPSTLHLWRAGWPSASSRTVLIALLLLGPCDAHCLAAFKQEARRILLRREGRPQGWSQTIETEDGLRRILLKFIADFANWNEADNPACLKTSRELVKAAHGEQAPLVVDPFARNGGAQVGKSSYDPAATGLGRPTDRLGVAALDILFEQGQADEATRPSLQQEMMHRETG